MVFAIYCITLYCIARNGGLLPDSPGDGDYPWYSVLLQAGYPHLHTRVGDLNGLCT